MTPRPGQDVKRPVHPLDDLDEKVVFVQTLKMPVSPSFAWLEITGFCNETCRHCYAGSSPQGTHGTMTLEDWKRVIDQLAEVGVRHVQFIGGEPTLHPNLSEMIAHARGRSMRGIEVFTNLTYVTDPLWETFVKYKVNLATSYYSDDAEDHDAVTETRGSHARVRKNLAKARDYGLTVRGAVITVLQGQRVQEAKTELIQLGVRDVSTDEIRPFGRGAEGQSEDIKKLCGRCGDGKFAVAPDGSVWPCVFSRWMTIGNVHEKSLAEILRSPSMSLARAEIEEVHGKYPTTTPVCLPDCAPAATSQPPGGPCAPQAACGPTQPKKTIGDSVRYYNREIARTEC